jgi:photosystem II PsbM protein
MHWKGETYADIVRSLFRLNSFIPTVTKVAFSKVAAGALPVAALSAPAFAMDSIVESLPTSTVALEVQFGAYLAIALGTLLPVLFLINLFIQTESRKAGREGGVDSE